MGAQPGGEFLLGHGAFGDGEHYAHQLCVRCGELVAIDRKKHTGGDNKCAEGRTKQTTKLKRRQGSFELARQYKKTAPVLTGAKLPWFSRVARALLAA
jgi:hypothetical protein